MDNTEDESKQKPFSSNIASRIWKIGSLTTSVSANVLANKIKETFSPSEDNNSKEMYKQIAEKVVKVMGELKGPWMKIGQYISLNDNVADSDFFESFSKLQYESPSMSYYFTKMQVEKELGQSPELIFKDFSRKAIGSASIGQVHEAHLKSGQKVAVKVQYPDMDKIIKNDLTTLKITLMPFKMVFKGKLEPIIEEVGGVLINELDYEKEAYHINLFREALKEDENVIIPEYYPEYSTKRILTMKFIEGVPLEKAIRENLLSKEEKNQIGHTLMKTFMKQLFDIKKIHADPHPGNFLIIDNNKVGWLDFGCIKTFEESFVSGYKRLIKAIIIKDPPNIRRGFVEMGFVNETETEKLDALEEFSNFLALPYINKDEFDLSENIDKLKEGQIQFKKMADKVGFRTPKDFIYLDRTVFGIGMILFKLKVKLNFYKEVEPYLFS